MIKKTLRFGLRLIKISTGLSVIFSLIIILAVGFFVVFPKWFAPTIENRLEAASGLTVEIGDVGFDFYQGDLRLWLEDFKIREKTPSPLQIFINRADWKIDLLNLLGDIYEPSDIRIDTLALVINKNRREANIKKWLGAENFAPPAFIRSLNIRRTDIQFGGENFALGKISIAHENARITVHLQNQNPNFRPTNKNEQHFDLRATVDFPLKNKPLIEIPVSLTTADFVLRARTTFLRENGDWRLSFDGKIPNLEVAKIRRHIPENALGKSIGKWLDAFERGMVENLALRAEKNLTKNEAAKIGASWRIKNGIFTFNPKWKKIQNLNAGFEFFDDDLKIFIDDAMLNDFAFSAVNIEIDEIFAKAPVAKIRGEIDDRSEAVIDFLNRSPVNPNIHRALREFSLAGKIAGNIDLTLPLLGDPEAEDEITATFKIENNRLGVENFEIENLAAEIVYRDENLHAEGAGDIRQHFVHLKLEAGQSPLEIEFSDPESGARISIFKMPEIWKITAHSDAISGAAEIHPRDEISIVDIQNLKINSENFGQGKQKWQITPNDIPSVFLKSRAVEIDDYALPNFQAQITGDDDILKIDHLRFENQDFADDAFVFNGVWTLGKTAIYARAAHDDLSTFLKNFDLDDAVRGGRFDADIRLFCDCNPWAFDWKNLSGYASVDVNEGILTNQDPGLGRILSLLNIQSIAKRLTLDLSDVVDEGFAYDKITASAHLKDGFARIENFNLSSHSNHIELSGGGDLRRKTYDLNAEVTPAISDSVPVATYLTGGGLAGLNVWLIDKVLFQGKVVESITDKVAAFEYKITGSWDEPEIQ